MKKLAFVLGLSVMAFVSRGTEKIVNGTSARGFSFNSYSDSPRGKRLDARITGDSVVTVSQREIVNQFKMQRFRNGDARQVELIAEAPHCQVTLSNSTLSDTGPLQIYTPTTNVLVQGTGFAFDQSHFLFLSNQVQTRVARQLLKSAAPGPAPVRPAAPAPPAFLYITSERARFDLNSNIVDYSGRVRVVDPQLGLTSDFLTVRLGTNGAVESILARQNVVLTTTNNGQATGGLAYYHLTNGGGGIMQLSRDAVWRNGAEEAQASQFTYDSVRHFLTATGHVRVQWPNLAPGQTWSTNAAGQMELPNGYRKLYADTATLQFPPTNGPVEHMTAAGNVIIINQADESSAMAGQASYDRASDQIHLSEHPRWWVTNMEVSARQLSADLAGRTYHAEDHAFFKMRTGGTSTKATNQWVFISAAHMEYQTNQALFSTDVEARLWENKQWKDVLYCQTLSLMLTNNRVQTALARDQVHGETAPNATGQVKTLSCQQLEAACYPVTGQIKTLAARTNVVIDEKSAAPPFWRDELTADLVTAQFSGVTNQIEKAVADGRVVLDQTKGPHHTHATAALAVYTAGTNAQVKLTGSPLARRDNTLVTNADYIVWQPASSAFHAYGLYRIIPVRNAMAKKSQ